MRVRGMLIAATVGVCGTLLAEAGKVSYQAHVRAARYEAEQEGLASPAAAALLESLEEGGGWRVADDRGFGSVLERGCWRVILRDKPQWTRIQVRAGAGWVDVEGRFGDDGGKGVRLAIHRAGWGRYRALSDDAFVSACQSVASGNNKGKGN